MEFSEKLQELRKAKGLTQEQLAECIFVSRTAVSKWESGRGYPSIDSLKEIAKFFSVTVDELLSGKELLVVAERDNKQKENSIRDLVFGLIDISFIMLFFLPLFASRINGAVYAVSLFALTGISLYLKVSFYVVVIAIVACGVATLALQNYTHALWLSSKRKVSLIINAVAVVLFVASLQPYAAVLAFVFLIVKTLVIIKW